MEEHVHDIVTKLYKLAATRVELCLGDGIQFSNHTNSLNEYEVIEAPVWLTLMDPNT